MKNADALDSLRAQGYAVGTPDAHTGRVRVWTRGSDEAVYVEIGSRRSMGAGYRAARPRAGAVLGALSLGLRWAPYGVAAITGGLVVGLLIALIADALFPRTRTSTDQHSPVSGRLLGTGKAKPEKCRASTTWQRLAEEKTCLEHLDAERAYRGDSGFGKTTEDRIVWGELLDLELQDIDEQVSRICQAAGDASGRRSRMSNNSPKSSSK